MCYNTACPPTMSFHYVVGYRDARLSILVLHFGGFFIFIDSLVFPWGLNIVHV